MKKIEKGSKNNSFWQSPQDNSKSKKKTGKRNRKKFLLAILRDNSKGKRGTNSHKGKNMKKIPKIVLKQNCLWQSPRTIPEAKGKNITKTKKHEKHTKKGSQKKQIDSRGKRRTNSQNSENMKQLKP